MEFNSCTEHSDWKRVPVDWEWSSRKGVEDRAKRGSNDGCVYYSNSLRSRPIYNYTNEYYRNEQVKELMENYVSRLMANLVLLGGDLNAGPETAPGKPFATV